MGRVNQFMDWLFERWGIIRPNLVATIEHEVFWWDDMDDEDEIDDDDEGRSETITFFLLEYPSGRRDYRFSSYGSCARTDYHELYVADVVAWTYGGQLPSKAKRPQMQADIIKLVKTDKPVNP